MFSLTVLIRSYSYGMEYPLKPEFNSFMISHHLDDIIFKYSLLFTSRYVQYMPDGVLGVKGNPFTSDFSL